MRPNIVKGKSYKEVKKQMGFDDEQELEAPIKPVAKKLKKVLRKVVRKKEEPEEVEEYESPADELEEAYLDLTPQLEEQTMVVKELPVQPIRKHKDSKTGITTNFITMEEAITSIENNLRKLTEEL